MERRLNILYRGPLSSCNYGCWYCPFAKRKDSADQLKDDRKKLNRFVQWTSSLSQNLGVLFTPWGEALTRSWYRQAIVQLSHQDNIARTVAQTNLSMGLGWLQDAAPAKVALWCTFHPGETQLDRFLQRCERLRQLQIRYSVGVVGLKENFAAIEELKNRLPADVYLWINAYKREVGYYDQEMLDFLASIDPHFPTNNQRHVSLGKSCLAGERSFTVDGDGDVRRCHFIQQPLGNIYRDALDSILQPRLCTNETCGCHIGYVYLQPLGLERTYGDRILERIPVANSVETLS